MSVACLLACGSELYTVLRIAVVAAPSFGELIMVIL